MERIEIDIQKDGSRRRDLRRILPGVVFSLISLVVIIASVDLGQVMEALRLADYRLVGLGIVIATSWLLMRGVVWRTLLQEGASFSQVFFTLNEGYLLNNVLPFRLGEVGRGFLLSRKAGLPFWGVISSILIERALDVAVAVGLLGVTLPFVVGASWARQAALGAGGVILVILIILYILALKRDAAMGFFEQLGRRWSIITRLGGNAIPSFLTGLEILTDVSRFLRAIAWITFNWGVGIIQYYVIMRAFFPEAKLLWASFCLGVAALGIAAPSTPGAVGVFELIIVSAMSIFSSDSSAALAFAVILHIEQYLITGLIGAYALARDGETLSGLYQQVRNLRRATPEA